MHVQETDFLGGFAKGLRVLEVFADARHKLSISDVAKLAGLDRATTRRCLLTLAHLGYADYDGKFFALTPRVLRLGHAYLSATPLPRIVQPYLDRLSREVSQSASVSVLDGSEIVYIARASHQRVMSINLVPGSRLPAYCASMGRIMLAALPPQEALEVISKSDLRAFTASTLTDPHALMEELAHVREKGYAIIDQELEIGLCSIAVPLRDKGGHVVAALNIGASAAQIPASELADHFLAPLRKTADALAPMLLQASR